MLGKIEGRRRRGLQRMRWLDGITEFEQAPGIDDGQRSLVCCSPWGGRGSFDAASREEGWGCRGTVPAGTPAVLRNILEHGRLAVDVSGCPPSSAGQASDAMGGMGGLWCPEIRSKTALEVSQKSRQDLS